MPLPTTKSIQGKKNDNRPTLAAGANRVKFDSAGITLIGDLYCPEWFDPAESYPAVVVGGPLASVKEQAAGVFARELATHGYLALAFDYRYYGESGGTPRAYENPSDKAEDLKNAIGFLGTLHNVETSRIVALGICASSSYISQALIAETRIKAFATVSGYFNLRSFCLDNPFITEEQKAASLNASNVARQKYYAIGIADRNDMIFPDMTGDQDEINLKEIHDYYFARVGECWPNFSNHLTVFSYEQLLASNAVDYAKYISTPWLGVVGSEAFTRPVTEAFYEAKAEGEKDIAVIDGATHIKAYDDPAYISQAVDAISSFYQRHIPAA
jgi:fermentation-respiration switch protein FrsA (DUF1100 family)